MAVKNALIPCLRYRDAPAAIEFLCSAFGFSRHAVYADEVDKTLIHHAQLTLGDAMVMLSSTRRDDGPDPYGWRVPAEAGGITMCVCAVIDDPDAHAAVARAAGAEMIAEPHDNQGYPGRGYEVRDPEGNVWSFASYDPFAKA